MIGYIITNDAKTVFVYKDSNGKYVLTTNKSQALIFDNKTTANSVFRSSISAALKNKGLGVVSVELKMVDESTLAAPVNNEDFGSSAYIVSVVLDAISKMNDRRSELVNELSKYDRQIQDIEHYIEFNVGKLNACDGYRAFKMLQDTLVERRKIKNELEIVQVVGDKMALSEDILNIDEQLQKQKNKQYTPRELVYLFDTTEKGCCK